MSAGGFSLNVASVAGVVAGTHQLHAVHVGNANAAARYLMVFDQVGAASAGEPPLYQFLVQAAGQLVVDGTFFGAQGLSFTNGIAWGVSTQRATFAAATASDHDVAIVYV